MQPYDWMLKYTPQKEWIERRGILLWLAFFFIELGAGMFFVASFFSNSLPLLVGWLLCAVLGGGFHLAFLGKPWRVWRMLFSSGWKTSWISRGLLFVSLFLLLGLIHLILGSRSPAVLMVAADVLAFLTVIYGGFAMNYVNGIPLWNTALLPVLYVISGFWGGAEVTLGLNLVSGNVQAGIEEWIRILLIGYILIIPVYLISVRYTSSTGQASVKTMLWGKWRLIFWVGVILIGMAVPLAAVSRSYFSGLESISAAFLYLAITCGAIGDLSARYLILRCGMYNPLIPLVASQRTSISRSSG